jgi:hypothetical protein
MPKAKMQKAATRKVTQPATAESATARSITPDVIAQRAYALYLARGGQDGHHLDDWYRAEQELLKGQVTPSPQQN